MEEEKYKNKDVTEMPGSKPSNKGFIIQLNISFCLAA